MTRPDKTELAARILASLEEARTDNVYSLINTIIAPRGEAHEATDFAAALNALIEEDAILLGLETFAPRSEQLMSRTEAIELVHDLPNRMAFKPNDAYWTFAIGDFRTTRAPFVRLRENGYRRAVEHLESRGYQWWRRHQLNRDTPE